MEKNRNGAKVVTVDVIHPRLDPNEMKPNVIFASPFEEDLADVTVQG